MKWNCPKGLQLELIERSKNWNHQHIRPLRSILRQSFNPVWCHFRNTSWLSISIFLLFPLNNLGNTVNAIAVALAYQNSIWHLPIPYGTFHLSLQAPLQKLWSARSTSHVEAICSAIVSVIWIPHFSNPNTIWLFNIMEAITMLLSSEKTIYFDKWAINTPWLALL